MRDQELGYFGFDATKEGTPQFLHHETVDLERALNETRELRMMWHQAQQHPDSPPFGGGVLSDWPAIAVDAFGVMNHEKWLIDLYLKSGRPRG